MKTPSRLTGTRRPYFSERARSDPATEAEARAAAEPAAASDRHRRISERAYLRAAARGFAGDRQLDDWLAAEREIDAETASRQQWPAPQPGGDANAGITQRPAKARPA